MVRISISIIILISGLFCKAQDKDDMYGDIILFNKGMAVYDAINEDLSLDNEIKDIDTTLIYDKKKYADFVEMKESLLYRALTYFTELVKKYPDSNLYFMALNNKAQLEMELDDPKSANETYIKILESKANDKDRGGLGSGLMAEPYANYKNRACVRLAELEYKLGNYNNAIKYLKLTEKYPYQHFCGNAFAGEELYMAGLFAKNYVALGDTKSALKHLLPDIFNNDFADNTEVVELTAKIIIKEFGRQKARSLFNDAKNTLQYKNEKRSGYTDENEFYTIQFLDAQIEVEMPLDAYDKPKGEALEIVRAQIGKSLINKLLNK